MGKQCYSGGIFVFFKVALRRWVRVDLGWWIWTGHARRYLERLLLANTFRRCESFWIEYIDVFDSESRTKILSVSGLDTTGRGGGWFRWESSGGGGRVGERPSKVRDQDHQCWRGRFHLSIICSSQNFIFQIFASLRQTCYQDQRFDLALIIQTCLRKTLETGMWGRITSPPSAASSTSAFLSTLQIKWTLVVFIL